MTFPHPLWILLQRAAACTLWWTTVRVETSSRRSTPRKECCSPKSRWAPRRLQASALFSSCSKMNREEHCTACSLTLLPAIPPLPTSLPPPVQILDWFVQICLALKHVHDRKILHRDIKSQVPLGATAPSLPLSGDAFCFAKTSLPVLHLEYISDQRWNRAAGRFWHRKGFEQVGEMHLMAESAAF